MQKSSWGKKGDDVNAAELWSSTALPELLVKYSPCDTYNANETGIYYFSTDKLSGSKKAKERVTALVACNMDSSDK